MINKHIQRNREMAKRNLLKRSFPRHEVKLYHVYDNPRELSYWDDFAFVLGSQRVVVTWIHPRMDLMDKVEELAFGMATKELGSPDTDNLFSGGKKIIKKVGKSRKKVVATGMGPLSTSFEAWHAKVQEHKAALYAGDISVGTKYGVVQLTSARHVAITYPVELRNEEEIFAFAAKVKAHMKGEINLFDGLEDYVYSTEDYRREHPE